MQVKWHDPQAVDFSIRLYQTLVRLYPAAFRDDYGELMVQVFRDSCLHASHSGGLLELWSRTLLDLFLSVIEQYANRGAVMTRSKWIKLSGWLLAASSVFFLIGWVASTRPAYSEYNAASWPIDRYLKTAANPLIVLGLLFILIGLLGLWARFSRDANSLGRVGLMLGMIGNAAAIVGMVGISIRDESPWWAIIMLGITGLFIGVGLFGVNCIQGKLLWRWNSLPLIISLPWPLILLADILLDSITGAPYNLPEVISIIFVVLPFMGLALIGYLLLSDHRGAQTALA